MAETKVLYENKQAPSGAADALFNMFKDDKVFEQKKAILGLEQENALARDRQTFQFNNALAELKDRMAAQREQETFERTKAESLLTGKAVGEEIGRQAVGQAEQGNVVPGYTDFSPEMAQATGTPKGAFTARPIDPRAATQAGKGFTDALNALQRDREIKLQAEEKRRSDDLQRTFQLIGDGEARQAASVADWFDKHAPDQPWGSALREFTTPGQGDKSSFGRILSQALAYQSAAISKLGYMKEHEALRLKHDREITGLKNKNAQAIAELKSKTTGNTAQLAQVKTQMQVTQQHITRVQERIKSLNFQLANSPPSIAGRIQAQIDQERLIESGLLADQEQLKDAIMSGSTQITQNPVSMPPDALGRKTLDAFTKLFPGKKWDYKKTAEDNLKTLSAEEQRKLVTELDKP